MKSDLKNEAIGLRKNGLSYSEILQQVPVAKSTLSIWFHSVKLSKYQKQRLTEKKLAAMSRGWETRRRQRIDRTLLIKQKAMREIPKISKDDLLLMGAMLYWAEGAKQKPHNIAQPVQFGNSDPLMIKVFLKWLKICLGVSDENIKFAIRIHENSKKRDNAVRAYWTSITGFLPYKFDKIYYKHHNILTRRKNIGEGYYGLLEIKVKRSTDLNRKITGWIEEICNQCRVV